MTDATDRGTCTYFLATSLSVFSVTLAYLGNHCIDQFTYISVSVTNIGCMQLTKIHVTDGLFKFPLPDSSPWFG